MKITLKETVETRVVRPASGSDPVVVSGEGQKVRGQDVERDGAEDEHHSVWKFKAGTVVDNVPDFTGNELVRLGYAEATA